MAENNKKKQRIDDFGEVFTPTHIVNDMLKIIPEEVRTNLDSTWLEPSCGSGHFLVEILYLKMKLALSMKEDFDLNAIRGLSSIYGVELQERNIKLSRKFMIQRFISFYLDNNIPLSEEVKCAAEYVISLNIIHSDFLTGVDPISGSLAKINEWIFDGSKVIRKEFSVQTCTNGVPTKVYPETDYLSLRE